MWAAVMGHLGAVKALLDCGAIIEARVKNVSELPNSYSAPSNRHRAYSMILFVWIFPLSFVLPRLSTPLRP
jgi:hypothetical protein